MADLVRRVVVEAGRVADQLDAGREVLAGEANGVEPGPDGARECLMLAGDARVDHGNHYGVVARFVRQGLWRGHLLAVLPACGLGQLVRCGEGERD